MGKGSGGGGLRLLPHKSWNVWNSDNLARVERDEVQHAQQQRQRQQRDRLAQHTQRITALRNQSQPSLDDEEQAVEAVAAAVEQNGSGGTNRPTAAVEQSFGQFAVQGGQPWYLRGDYEKDARQSRQERAQVEQQQQKERAEAVLRRIRMKEERKVEDAGNVDRHVRLAELLGGEKKEADDPLDVMRYYVQRTKEYQRLHELVLDPPPMQTTTHDRPPKREHNQPAEVIELSSGSDSDRDDEERHRRRHREKHSTRHRRRSDRSRDEEEENDRERKRRRRNEEEEKEDEKRRQERRTQIVQLLQQLDNVKAAD